MDINFNTNALWEVRSGIRTAKICRIRELLAFSLNSKGFSIRDIANIFNRTDWTIYKILDNYKNYSKLYVSYYDAYIEYVNKCLNVIQTT